MIGPPITMSIDIPKPPVGIFVGMATKVGDRIREVREHLGLKPSEFARRIGISQPSLWDLEHGETKHPAAETLHRMHERLRVNPDYIMRGRGNKFIEHIEEQLEEQTLLSMFRELEADKRDAVMTMIKALRRAQPGNSPNDPFKQDPPEGGTQ